MSVRITYFVHGTTIENEQELAPGWADGVLSKLGIEQAKDLGPKVDHLKFDAIFCSDLQRAIDSAELAFGDKYQGKIHQDDHLRECHYGKLQMHPVAEFKDRMAEYIDEPFPDGESYREVEFRMRDFLHFLKKNYDGKHVAIVAHQAPQLALEVILNNKTWQQAIDEDWRRKEDGWQPGWEYVLE